MRDSGCIKGRGPAGGGSNLVGMPDTVVVSEWDAELFHQRVLELEREGYVARRESYRITAEMNPETGLVSHVHSMELWRESDAG